MSKRSHQDLVESARPLLAQHGTLSVVYLMRKLRIDWDEAEEIMVELGLPIYITAEEYRKGQNRTSKVGEWLSG